MGHGSYMDVFSLGHHEGEAERVKIGDIVQTSDNYYPRFAVLAIHGHKAWVRNVETGQDSLCLLERCKLVEEEALAVAAE